MMSFEIIFTDLKNILSDFRPHDVGPFFFWCMWLLILCAPLKDVDRRDELAQLTYMAIVAAFGVLFVFVFPIGRVDKISADEQIVLFSILLLGPSIRWMMHRRISELEARILAATSEVNVTSKKKGG